VARVEGVLKFALVVLVVAACVYFVIRALEKRGGTGGGGRPEPRRPLGPDDDPDFLWGLNKKFRQEHPRKPGDEPPTTPSAPS